MIKILPLILAFTISPIWPLGPNPLPGDPFVIVNKATNELAFIQNEEIQGIYKIATGKTDDLTPEGLFTITVKAKNPYYRKDNIAGGSPENPLGSRWIGFDAKETNGRIYGVHGTNSPWSIGRYVSLGCIRMHNEEVEEIFEKIPLGTRIWITETDKKFEELAREKRAIQ